MAGKDNTAERIPTSDNEVPDNSEARSVPGPRAPHGTARSPSREKMVDRGTVCPIIRRMGTPTVTPMPNPVTDSAKGTKPKTTNTVQALRDGALVCNHPEMAAMAPLLDMIRLSRTPA